MSQTREQYLEKPLPSSPESERVILGAILLDNELISHAVEELQPDDFYSPLHKKVYRAMCELFESGNKIDPILIGEELKKEGQLENLGGISTITNLTYGLPHFSDIETYTKVVKDKATSRNLIRTCNDITTMAFGEEQSVEDLTNIAEQKIFDACNAGIQSEYKTAGELAFEMLETAQKIARGEIKTVGVSSGFTDIDNLVGGWKPADLIVIAALPGMGKTSLVSQFVLNAVANGLSVAFFSLEMTKEQLIKRLACTESKTDGKRLDKGFLTKEEWARLAMSADKISNYKLHIDDTPSLTTMELLAKARRFYAINKKLDLVVVDYLQLMKASRKTESETAETTQISKDLKAIAKLLKVPIIAISSLSKKSEDRTDKKPLISDLRQSGQIGYDADVISFLYREEYHRPNDENAGIAEFKIAKQRNGPTGDVKLAFMAEYTRFENFYQDESRFANYYEKD